MLSPYPPRGTTVRLLVLTCVLSLSAVAAAPAQERQATLAVTIVDDTGMPVPATVRLRHENLGTERTLSAPQGAYRADALVPGEYQVTATSDGFTAATRRIALAPGASRTLRLQLHVGTLTEDVLVVATEIAGSHETLRRLPGSVDVLERDTLERSRVFTTNEALRKLPGVHVRDEEGLGLRPNIGIRGINPTRSNKVLLLEDGIPLTYAPYGDNASYYHPPIERFSRVEIMKGGAQIAYGPQTVAGVINYVTPTPPAEPAGSITLTGGNRNYFNGHASYGASVGRSGFLLDYMRKQSDGARENVESKLNDVNGKVVTAAGRHMLTFRGNYYSEDSNITYSGLRTDEYLVNPRANPFRNDFFYIDRYGTSGTHALPINGNAVVTTNVYYSSFRRHWWRQSSNSNERPNDASDPNCGGMANLDTTCGNQGRLRQYHTWGVEPRLRVQHRAFGVSSETDFGVRAHFERQDRRQENGDTALARTGLLVEDNLRTNDAYSGFVQNRFLLAGWTITPGVRLEHVRLERTNRLANAGAGVTGASELTRLVPGVGVSHASGDALTWFAGVHRGFAPPRTEDVISNSGGAIDLDPELSWNYELGVRTMVTPGARLDATLFVMDYENQIVPASLAGGVGALLTNGGETLHRGLEVAGKLDTAPLTDSRHNVFVRTAYTFVPVSRFTGTRFSSVSGFSTTSVTGNRIPYAPTHLATIGGGYAHPAGFDVGLEAVHTGEQFGDDLNTVVSTPNGQRGLLPGYTLWNLAMNMDVQRARFFFAVKNLLDDVFIVDRSRGILPGTPRLVQAGVTVRF
jgi:Fe(3+) dicitrate transport protein